MRLGGYRTSDNVRDQGQGGGGFGFGGGGGGGGGCLFALLPMVLRRFGIGGVLILLLGYCALSFMGGGGGLGVGGPGTTVAPHQQGSAATNDAAQACSSEPAKRFSCQVLANTEDTWTQIFAAKGQRYQPTALSFYGGGGDSGCGAAQSAMGPFYCPTDATIYLDTAFFDELQNRFHAAGDFAQAYVIAHEVGHHIQDLMGTLGKVQEQQGSLSAKAGSSLQVRVELQADCYAGVWAANAKARDGGALIEAGDI